MYILMSNYTTSQKFLNSKIFRVSSAHKACIYLIQNTAKAVIVKYFYYLK